jgi:hypothetical protein
MTLLETRLGQTERRIEREMTQIHSKMDDVFRSIPDKSYVFSFIFLYRLVQSTISVQTVDILSHLITKKNYHSLVMGSSPEALMRGMKQIQDQLNVIEEILLERSPASNQIRGKNRHQHNGKANQGPSSVEVNTLRNCASQENQ